VCALWTRRSASAAHAATSIVAIPPTPRATRAPNCPATQPLNSAPTGVEPWNTIAHSAITRPRMALLELSCSSELAVEMNMTLAPPIRTSSVIPIPRVGATATARIVAPNARVTLTSSRWLGR